MAPIQSSRRLLYSSGHCSSSSSPTLSRRRARASSAPPSSLTAIVGTRLPSPPPLAPRFAPRETGSGCPGVQDNAPVGHSNLAQFGHLPSSSPELKNLRVNSYIMPKPIFSRLHMSRLGSRSMITPTVRVQFETGIVDMIGGACTGAGYSLPGAVIITLPALPAGFEGRYRLLKDVTVIVEGQSEYWDATGRYTPLRLFATTLPLIPAKESVLIPSHDTESSDRSSRVTLVLPFDLRLPGWLPPTMISTYTSNFYGVVVTAEVAWGDQHLSHIVVPSLETATGSSGYSNFIVRRHRVPTALCPTATIRERTFAREGYSVQLGKMLSFIIVLPEWVDTHAESLDLSLRICICDEEEEFLPTKRRLRISANGNRIVSASTASDSSFSLADTTIDTTISSITSTPGSNRSTSRHMTHIRELGMEVEELGQFFSHPIRNFTRQFPLPREQPSRIPNGKGYPLLGPCSRPEALAFDIPVPQHHDVLNRPALQRLCLLSDEGTQRRYQFPGMGKGLGTSWRRIRFVLPMPHSDSPSDATRPTPDSDTPFLKLRHTLNIRVVLLAPGFSDPESITVAVPIRFGSRPETLPAPSSHCPPPYISVFHENGDLRACDPLPLYPGTPVATTFPTSRDTSEPMVIDSVESTPSVTPEPQLRPLHEPMYTEPSEDSHEPQSSSSTSCASSPNASPDRRAVKLPSISQVQWSSMSVETGHPQ